MKKIRFLFVLVCIIMAVIGLVKVNILNTRALSPLEKSKESYEEVKNRLGKDFSEFITDNCDIKIYSDEKDNILIRVGSKDFKIREESAIIEKAGEVINVLENYFQNIIGK